MIKGGYILSARKSQDSAINFAPPHYREVWRWLLFNANFKDCGRIKRGQLLVTINEIREGLHWFVGYRKEMYSVSQCENATKWLKRAGMIAVARTVRGVIVTICNYDYYQDIKNYECRDECRNESLYDAGMMPNDKGKKGKKGKKENISDINISLVDEESSTCPHQKIISTYHSMLPTLRKVKVWNATRQSYLKARWNESEERQNIEWWQDFFSKVANSDFLLGNAKARNGNQPFQADLEWLVRPNNFSKVIEGKYDNQNNSRDMY